MTRPHAPAVSRRFGIFLNVYMLLVLGGIGGMQMYGVDGGFWTDYGADLLAPPYMYLAFRAGRWRMRPSVALLVVLGGCFVWEGLQRYDLSGTPLAITRGRFDPGDLVAYTVGLLVCYAVDLLWLRPRGILPSRDARVAGP